MAIAAIDVHDGRTTDADGDRRVEASSVGLAVRMGVKRGIDVVASLLALLLLVPVFLVVSIAILVVDGRPVFFAQSRVGRGGHPFRMFKFRTMTTDAEQRKHELDLTNERTGPIFKVNDDPRVTRTGRWLRRTSLDELPQFLNVLLGHMSLVGPRPALPDEVAEFPPALRRRESVPQGITGLWQVEGRTDADFATYAALDLRYLHDWSLRMDLGILLRTPWVVARQAWSAKAVETAEPDADARSVADADPFLVRRLALADDRGALDLTLDLREPDDPRVEYVIDLRDRAPQETSPSPQ